MSGNIPNYGAALPKEYQGESTGDIKDLGIKKLFRMIILGPSFSGKNNLVFYILKHSPNAFTHLHIVARNPSQELYDYLKDKLAGFVTIYDPDDPPRVDQIRKTKDNGIELVVIDDYSNDANLQKNLFSHYFTRGRHFKLSTIFLSRSYFATNKMIRLNSEYCAILKANSRRDLKLLFKDFNLPGVTEEKLVQSYEQATKEKGQMLFIDSIRVTINARHLVENGYNNTFRYSFPGANVDLSNTEVAVGSIAMYNSQFNINAIAYSNNSFKVEVPTASTVSTISVTLNDGYYTYADINRMIQTALVNAGAFLVDSDGNRVFFIQLTENATYYSAQVDLSSTPTTLGTYTRPATGLYSATGTGLPTTSRVPRLIFGNAEFGKVTGFTVGSYPSSSSTSSASFLSNIVPQVNPVSSYALRCSLIDNPFTLPSDILTTFNAAGTTIGQLISYKPNEYSWMTVSSGSYANITITIVDQEERFVRFRDKNVLIALIFRQKNST
ncbi:hypothetical protein FI667_g13420, partial [Globisporangium splendens]